MGKLDVKVAIVTGAAQGMGAEEARILAVEGAQVVMCDILDGDSASVTSGIGAEYRHFDVTNEQDWSDLAGWAESSLGRIDILVNNAGVVGFTPVASTELSEWNRVIGINLTGVFLGIRAMAPGLARAGGGVTVNISSSAGIMGYSNPSAYVASKWGVRGLTKAAALDLAKDGTRVVSVHPGGVRTPMTAGVASEDFYARQPIPRVVKPIEIAKLVLYLVADATYSTGTEFIADGGATVGPTLDI